MPENLENRVNSDPRTQTATEESPKGLLYHTGNYLYDSVRLATGLVCDGAKAIYKGISWPFRTALKASWQLIKNPFVLMGAYLATQIGGLYGSGGKGGSNGGAEAATAEPTPNVI